MTTPDVPSVRTPTAAASACASPRPLRPARAVEPRTVLRAPGAALLVLLALLAGPPGWAAVPEPEPEPAAAEPDTGRFLPPWLHYHGSVGLGWISAPVPIRQRYQAGQDFELGLEVRPRANLRARVSGEYQVLPAVGRATYQIVTFMDPDGGTLSDTLSFDWLARGWLGAANAEVQWRALPHTWLLAGAGRGYLEAGVRAYHFKDPFIELNVEFPGSSGWAWITMLGARYEFDLFGPVLGAEVRWSTLDRPQDVLRTWSIRVGWQGR